MGSLCDQLPTRSPLSTADIFLRGGGRGEAREGEGGEYGSLPTAPYSTTDIGTVARKRLLI